MKKYLLISICVFTTMLMFGQNGKQRLKNKEKGNDFTYEKINILNKEEGNLLLKGGQKTSKTKKINSQSNRSYDTGIGETLGELSVSLTGGATYSIPIAVPPGIADITPDISLVYNSQNGNGLAGYGWNISGVSSISRVPSTKYHDNQIDGVDFDASDRFALDGQRLILKSGTYGGNGAEYETEIYSNIKITSHGVSPIGSNYGPEYFIVHYPDGSFAHYGNSSDSRSHTTYSITYWENPQGIRISYTYSKTDNSLTISKIKYGSIHSTTPINEIHFGYSFDRSRREQAYTNDISFTQGKLLKKIRVYGESQQYRYYDLLYNQTGLNYDRLSSVTEYSGDETLTHSSVMFNYSDTTSSVNYTGITTDLLLQDINYLNSEVVPLDITGNEKMDFIVYPKSAKDKFWLFRDLDVNGSNYSSAITPSSNFETILPTVWLDQNDKITSGTGLTIVHHNETTDNIEFKVYSNGVNTQPITHQYSKTWTNAPTYNHYYAINDSITKIIPREYVSGDFNGDGLTDVLSIGKSYSKSTCYEIPCGGTNVNEDIEAKIEVEEGFRKSATLDTLKNKKKPKKIDIRMPPPGGGDEEPEICSACGTSTYYNRGVYFIDLDRSKTTGFVNFSGSLQHNIDNDDQILVGDFNGDGKSDLFHIKSNAIYVYGINDNNVLYLIKAEGSTQIDPDRVVLLGDYNGDGKSDILMPENDNSSSFALFLSTGTDFYHTTTNQPFTYRTAISSGGSDPINLTNYNLLAMDVNGDGRTDIIDYKTTTSRYNSNGKQTVSIYNNLGYAQGAPNRIEFEHGGYVHKDGNLKHYPIPIILTSDQPNNNLEFATISNQWVTPFSFTMDHREDTLLRSIENNGVTHTIEYRNLNLNENSSSFLPVYQSDNNQTYPNVDLFFDSGTKVVSSLGRVSSGVTTLRQDYSYYGGVYNLHGQGFLGFKGIAKSNWHTNSSDRIFTVYKYDPSLRGALTHEYSLVDNFTFSVPTTTFISKTTHNYTSSLTASKVFKLSKTSSLEVNNLNNTYTNLYYQYNSYNDVTKITENYSGYGSKVTDITYSNNTGSGYYIGRPTSEIITNTIGSEVFTTEKQFVYTGYLLTQVKTKGNATPFDIENYEHDVFGNITKKIIVPNGASPREVQFEYDNSGRYLTKSIDVEGLETTFLYNTHTGTLAKDTNPYGQETNYTYDSWNRLTKVTDYLGNDVTKTYVETSNSYTITETSDDGSETVTIYDPLKRVTKTKEKDVFGNWVSVSYVYDKFDRVWKQSEPYTGSSPSQWNVTDYDFYGRPITQTLHTGKVISISYNNLSVTVNDGTKTVTSTSDAMGNTVSVTDPGGTINYTYFGNGSLKTANYNGVIVSTEQDGWGRKTKTIDPSAGTYTYTYNAFGEILTETTPKGTTSFTYSPLGKITQKSIVGDNTNTTIQYSYNPINKFLSSISTTSTDGNNTNYTYTYDSYSRLEKISEITPYAKFTKDVTYDSFGRVNTQEYYSELLSNNRSSTKTIKNIYQNGVLKSLKDNTTNEVLWDLNSVNARGQVTSATMGNDILEQNTYDSYGYLTESKVEKDASTTAQEIMKLTFDFNVQRGVLNSRSNSLFSWSETFGYDSLDRLVTFNDNDGNGSNTYDSSGRITYNNTIGDYNYTGTSYQLDGIDLNTQGDLYYQRNQLQQVTYNAFKKPFEINEEGKEKIGFQYNAFNGRSNMFYGGTENDIYQRNNRKHYSYEGSMEISHDYASNKTTFITYIGGDGYSAPVIWRSEQGASSTLNDYYYLHRDYLGSILMISDEDGNVKEKRHFDAWGNIVKLTDGNNTDLERFSYLDRGYTGHEHLQGVKLIHMNGRLYDAKLKRFLAPDNFIQDQYNTQNFNRYGYAFNNPLMYTDPSGEFIIEALVYIGYAIFAYAAVSATVAIIKDLSNNSNNSANTGTSNPINSINQNNSVELSYGMPKPLNIKPRLEYKYGINENLNTYSELLSHNPVGSSNFEPFEFPDLPNNGRYNITVEDVVNTTLDFTPVLGGVNDIRLGIRDGDGWQVALGVGIVVLDVFTLGSASVVKGSVKTALKGGKRALKSSKNSAKTWNQFQKMTKGRFATRADAGDAWRAYKNANGIITGTLRSQSVKRRFLKELSQSSKTPKFMNQWLRKGKVPPGYHVDHQKALFDGGLDVISNMRLKDISTHINRHKTYRPR